MREHEEVDDEQIIVRSLKQPSCVKAEINNNTINYTIEKELGVELVGDIKVKIEADLEEDPWDEIEDTTNTDKNIDNVNENFMEDTI